LLDVAGRNAIMAAHKSTAHDGSSTMSNMLEVQFATLKMLNVDGIRHGIESKLEAGLCIVVLNSRHIVLDYIYTKKQLIEWFDKHAIN
jgi:hypothetical protein